MSKVPTKKAQEKAPPPPQACDTCGWGKEQQMDFHVECVVPLPPMVQKSHDWKHRLSNRMYCCALWKPKT